MREVPPFGDRSRRRIGLLGGSFNPAHDGHLHVSRAAMKHLGLDAVWWLVSPQNPLKDPRGMAPLRQRVASARKVARADRHVIVTDLERAVGTVRTLDTLRQLQRRYPRVTFVWLMGADNLAQVARWWRWPEIFRRVRVAVFDRSPYSYAALARVAAQRFAAARVPARRLRRALAPAWSWVPIRRHPASATAIRATRQSNAA